jgi:hypothetical protein
MGGAYILTDGYGPGFALHSFLQQGQTQASTRPVHILHRINFN